VANPANRLGSVRHRHGEPRCIDLLALDGALGERKAKVARLIDHCGLGQSRVAPGLSLPGSTRLRVESIVKRVPRQGTGDEMAPRGPRAATPVPLRPASR
jgi:hypothetical protein